MSLGLKGMELDPRLTGTNETFLTNNTNGDIILIISRRNGVLGIFVTKNKIEVRVDSYVTKDMYITTTQSFMRIMEEIENSRTVNYG